jgi:hypothetical protein
VRYKEFHHFLKRRPFMKEFDIEYTSDNLQSNSGLIFTGHIFQQPYFKALLKNAACSDEAPKGCYSDLDILLSGLGLLSMGHSDFEDIDQYRNDPFFPKALGISAVPSKETLRQRMDKLARRKRTKLFPALQESNIQLLSKQKAVFSPIASTLFIPLDFDVTPMDNSGSHKEGVEQTYKKEVKGYAPMMTYIGAEGYLLNHQFRKGSAHSNTKGTLAYIKKTIGLARRLTDQPLLARFDCANDASENAWHLSRFDDAFYIIKRNGAHLDPAALGAFAIKEAETVQSPQRGVKLYFASRQGTVCMYDKKEEKQCEDCREVVCLIEQLLEKDGQKLLFPKRTVYAWRTNLPDEFSACEVVDLYKDHGTSEQFHAEFKGELDMERLPSGKFKTNRLLMALAQLSFNFLRLLGQQALQSDLFCTKAPVKRLRLRTVIRKLMCLPSRFIIKCKRWCLKIPEHNPFSQVFEWLSLKSSFA